MDAPTSSAQQTHEDCVIARDASGLLLTVPPDSPERQVAHQLGTALCIVMPLTYLLICIMSYFFPQDQLDVRTFDLPFFGLFFAAGLGLMTVGRRLAGQEGTIEIRDGKLRIDITGPWDPLRRFWPVDQIETVRAAAAGWTSNGHPAMQLEIQPKQGPVVQLFAGRAESMLRRIAEVLEHELQIPSREVRIGAWLRPPARITPPSEGSGIVWIFRPIA